MNNETAVDRGYRIPRRTPRAWVVTVALVLLGLLTAAIVYAEKRPSYTLSETQVLRLKVIHSDAVNLKMQFDRAQSDLQQKLHEWDEACGKIRTENNLPAAAVCDINNPGSVNPPAAPAPPQAPAKK